MKIRVLLIQNTISHYRLPIYNKIAETFDLTVAYSYGDIPKECKFKIRYLPMKKKWRFFVHDKTLKSVVSEYNVVIGMLSVNWVSISLLGFGKHNYKFIPWGIGVPASYSVRFDDSRKWFHVYLILCIIRSADAALFYTDYPIKKYSRMGISKSKLFVAHNTVDVLPLTREKQKKTFLFVGSLYKAKSIKTTLELYKKAFGLRADIPSFEVIGEGDEYKELKLWVADNNLEEKIHLHGAVYDETVLRAFFESALICISLGQAGLTVQKSFGYATPFVTMDNAFTGGERLDIVDGVNGLLLKEEEELCNVFIKAASEPEYFIGMGQNAYKYYRENCTIDVMYHGVKKAIEYVCGEKVNK